MTTELTIETAAGVADERRRLEESRERAKHWKRWGPYLSERAWGTVREDYSSHGSAWDYLPHDHARSKAYRWDLRPPAVDLLRARALERSRPDPEGAAVRTRGAGGEPRRRRQGVLLLP